MGRIDTTKRPAYGQSAMRYTTETQSGYSAIIVLTVSLRWIRRKEVLRGDV